MCCKIINFEILLKLCNYSIYNIIFIKLRCFRSITRSSETSDDDVCKKSSVLMQFVFKKIKRKQCDHCAKSK